jgi:hypothetical protein
MARGRPRTRKVQPDTVYVQTVNVDQLQSRLETEQRHDPECRLETEEIYRRVRRWQAVVAAHGQETPDPPDDSDPVAMLEEWGVGVRYLNLAEQHGCSTIADLHDALRAGEIETWANCGPVATAVVHRALIAIRNAKLTERKGVRTC